MKEENDVFNGVWMQKQFYIWLKTKDIKLMEANCVLDTTF